LLVTTSGYAAARDATSGSAPDREDVTDDVPRVAYAHLAFVGTKHSVGAATFGIARSNGTAASRPWLGGGLRLWGVPVTGLGVFGEAQRRDNGEFAPSLGVTLQVAGSTRRHFALSILGRYVAEGFAELEGEVEAGMLASYSKQGLHLDANAIVGAGFEEEEADGEFLGRFGYEVLGPLRLGAEGRVRQRLAGDARLAGNRNWDALGGAQALLAYEPVVIALTAGPSTVGVVDGVGWTAIATVAAVAY
jgi:hypothetical protein